MLFVRHVAISVTNFSMTTLVLQKQRKF